MSSSATVDDVERSAMALCAQGKGEGLETLYRLHAGRCTSLARRVVRDHQHAQDVVQEAFLDLWRHAHRYDGERATPLSWLLTLTYRKAVDRLRREQVRSTVALRTELDPPDQGPGPDVHALHQVDVQLAARAIRELPPREAEVLVFAYWGGLSQSEISAVVGIPLGTVKTRTRSGLQRLNLALQPAPAGSLGGWLPVPQQGSPRHARAGVRPRTVEGASVQDLTAEPA